MTPRLAYSPAEAAASLGMGLTKFKADVLPALNARRVGRRILIPVAELERWLAGKPAP